MTCTRHSIAPDAHFLPRCAAQILAFLTPAGGPADLSTASLLLPNLKLAPALNDALRAVAGGPLLLPRIGTLSSLVEPWLTQHPVMPDARRQLILHSLLRRQNWLDEAMLWDVVAELTQLFDTLTEYAVKLPANEAELLEKLERGFELKDSQPLNFEARLVNTLWRAEAEGEHSCAAARLLAAASWVDSLTGPLIVMLEAPPSQPMQALIEQAAARVPVLVLEPTRAVAEGELAELLARVWPAKSDAPPLRARMEGFSADQLKAARERLRLVEAESLEDLGAAVAQQVIDWLIEGRREIAMIACDRLAARRARALLEREGVLVQDETGWKLVTTRVAAVVDAWLEVIASDAWHRALIDLLRAPLIFADLDPLTRGQGADAVERLIRESSIASGLDRLRAEAVERQMSEALPLLDRLIEARAALRPNAAGTLADWLRRLHKSLDLLGALPHFNEDQAGLHWLEWLETRAAELTEPAGDEVPRERSFRFAAWRTWFNRQMDAELYRDESIASPVIMTHLAATRLRPFDAAIVIGADAEHLAPPAAPGWLTHAGVRHELGLPGLDLDRAQLREDLAGLVLASDAVVIAWQSLRRDEALMPAAEVAVLEAALRLASGESLVDKAAPRACPASPDVALTAAAAPSAPTARVPTRVSASSLQTLINCPYRYFARYVLRLAELDELSEGMEKKDFGELLHRILRDFHAQHRTLAGHSDEALLAALEGFTEAAFAGVVARNFQDHAWRLRWRGRLADYIAWQRDREKEGWRWQGGEVEERREHEIGPGRSLTLQGRIDRVDVNAVGQQALLDYKSRAIKPLRDQVQDPDDVQLAFYALLTGQCVAEAAYVALDGDELAAAPLAEPEERAGSLQDLIDVSFNAMLDGARMPAQGTAGACQYCEMRGLCRKEWVA
ncbi:PD-(D/E)XK nuclease family protein [Uliginosibacterium aquaticum]|uniref:PD-(D/E)XK nuclease family protein n=1 Tax=Uliginosibacterium aquaticum TaxID=2731212 RepID=A0ABX2IJ68_9RHOO|nr:PD-(D/E)XK nuclease family protein [Uliginosibacterium aquaticum]NSL54669.1 PD-(D/E)XK nuclease family protein [Uliginosibacterium aquaticum]